MVILGMLAFAGPDAEAADRRWRRSARWQSPMPISSSRDRTRRCIRRRTRTIARPRRCGACSWTASGWLRRRPSSTRSRRATRRSRSCRSACSAAPTPGCRSDATAYAHRTAPIMLNLVAFWTTPEDKIKREAWVDGVRRDADAGRPGRLRQLPRRRERRAGGGAYPGATWRPAGADQARRSIRRICSGSTRTSFRRRNDKNAG